MARRYPNLMYLFPHLTVETLSGGTGGVISRGAHPGKGLRYPAKFQAQDFVVGLLATRV
jgi:hypothetical protein